MATRVENPDRVPSLLALFFLDLGLRAGEVVRLTTQDIDLSNRLRPVVHVCYSHRRHRAKRRELTAPPDLSVLVDGHLATREGNGHQLHTYSSRDIRRTIEEL